VVTVSYRSEEVLPAFLDSVGRATDRPVHKFVADNLPEAGTLVAELAQQWGAEYRPMTSNLGYGGAMNAVAETLDESIEWILIANPDVVLSPNSIDLLVDAGDSDPAIGSVGPAVLTVDGDVYPSARAIPSLRTGIGHALFANLWLDNPWTKAYRRDDAASAVRRDAGWLSGACVLVRRSAFDRIAGFDTGYFMYFEDVDLGFRLGQLGYRNLYEPEAVVRHIGAHSTEGESAAMVVAHHASAKRFLKRKYPGPFLWPVRAALSIGLAVRSNVESKRAARAAHRSNFSAS
jgi:N-acetylglucosaminyl-diphospho-decaprenol L-rhamnosyltransferase